MDDPVWRREQWALFTRTRDERLPAAHGASRILQGAFGIGLDKNMVANIPVRVWALPELPAETMQEVVARFTRETMVVAARQAAENAARAAGGVVSAGEIVRVEMPRRALPAQPRMARMPSVVLHHADGVANQETLVSGHVISQPMLHRPESTSQSQTAGPSSTYQPALPPPNWQPHPRDFTPMPCYWSPQLSKTINRWLAQEATISTQVPLQRLMLGGVAEDGSVKKIVTFLANENVRIKLTQLNIPPSAQNPSTAWRPLQWLVLQVEHLTLPQVETAGGEKKTIPMPYGGLPYWLMAFPTAAVTKSEVQKPTIQGSNEKSPKKSSSTGSQGLNEGNSPKPSVKSESELYNWMVFLSIRGQVPAVHGRGANPKVLKKFMEASACGKAVVQVSSEDVALIRGG